jgi:hypothetical protein
MGKIISNMWSNWRNIYIYEMVNWVYLNRTFFMYIFFSHFLSYFKMLVMMESLYATADGRLWWRSRSEMPSVHFGFKSFLSIYLSVWLQELMVLTIKHTSIQQCRIAKAIKQYHREIQKSKLQHFMAFVCLHKDFFFNLVYNNRSNILRFILRPKRKSEWKINRMHSMTLLQNIVLSTYTHGEKMMKNVLILYKTSVTVGWFPAKKLLTLSARAITYILSVTFHFFFYYYFDVIVCMVYVLWTNIYITIE